MSGLGLTFLRRGNLAHPTAGSDYILSETKGDPEVFRILMEKGVSSDGVGITKEDAEKVTSISTWFKGNSIIKDLNVLVYFIKVSGIAQYAFQGCQGLKSINLDNVTSLDGYNFMSALDGADIKLSKVANIWGNQAFYRSGAASIDLTGCTFTATQDSFAQQSTRLKKITFHEALKSIGWQALNGCTALQEVISLGITPPSLQSDSLGGTNSTFVIYVPDEAVDAYKAATNWKNFASRIKPLSEY